jgi:hypothetical protein
MKTYEFGIDQVYPTDCTLYITDGEISKTFGIDGESWKMVSALRLFIPSEKLADNHDVAAIARHLLYSNTSQDEI